MFEINLVPDVKNEMLKKQKLRNLIVLVCIGVGIACVVLLVVLFSIAGAQGLKIDGYKHEIACRYDNDGGKGGDSCKSFGTAIMDFDNAQEILTIQKQMENVGILNDRKVKLSRIFGVMDVILPNHEGETEDTVEVTDLRVNLVPNWQISFNANASSNDGIHYRAVENFQKGLTLSYYDYGHYMRKANSSEESEEADENGYVAIPGYCVTETIKDGYIFGIYHKGMPNCEEDLVADKNTKNVEETDPSVIVEQEEEGSESLINAAREDIETKDDKDFWRIYETNNKVYKVHDIYIRRTYRNLADKEKYQKGTDTEVQEKLSDINNKVEGNLFFESSCLQYDGSGKLDETATRELCPVVTEELSISKQSLGRDSYGNLKLSFDTTVPLNKEIFLAKNEHMQVRSSTRQNVTDSYVQIRDVFSEKLNEGRE